MNKLGTQSLNSLKGQHPNMVRVMMASITDCPIDFTITDGGRTTAKQQHTYAQGRTIPGPIVTEADGIKNKSNHQAKADGFYHAVDLYPYINGKVDFDDKQNLLPVIAAHIKATAKCMGINIGWGGDWKATKTKPKGWDKPHFQLEG